MTKRKEIKELEFDDELFVKIPTLTLFEKWVKEGDWKNGDHFFAETGINPIHLIGTWFTVVHGRVYYYDGAWTDKEVIKIIKALDGMCADIDNSEITYYHKGLEYNIWLDSENTDVIHYTVKRLYRNSKGDVIDDEIIHTSKFGRDILVSIVKRMVTEIRS